MSTTLKTEVIRARIEPSIKKKAETILKRIGVSHSTFINMSYRAVIAYKGIPLDFRTPTIGKAKPTVHKKSVD